MLSSPTIQPEDPLVMNFFIRTHKEGLVSNRGLWRPFKKFPPQIEGRTKSGRSRTYRQHHRATPLFPTPIVKKKRTLGVERVSAPVSTNMPHASLEPLSCVLTRFSSLARSHNGRLSGFSYCVACRFSFHHLTPHPFHSPALNHSTVREHGTFICVCIPANSSLDFHFDTRLVLLYFFFQKLSSRVLLFTSNNHLFLLC